MRLSLTKGKFARIDDEDFERVKSPKWYAFKNGRTWYARRARWIKEEQRYLQESLHRVIMRASPKETVDHKDGDGLNCMKSNMRICTGRQNAMGKKTPLNNTSGYKGVCFVSSKDHLRNKPWRAQIKINGKYLILKYHETPEKAAEAYNAAAVKYFGEYARLNVIP